jgi:hypothetical protein
MGFFFSSQNLKWFLFFSFFFLYKVAFSQGVKIEMGESEISLNQPFTISIVSNNEKIRTYDNFPDIPGFVKRGTSSSTSTNIINGQVSFSQTTTQNYMPLKEGRFQVKPFTITVNGEPIRSKGITVTVGPPQQVQSNPFNYDPFEDFFGRRDEPKEFVDIKADAFFGLMTNKDEVYVGEGVTATLAFFVAAENRAEMEFYDLGNQLNEILKKMKPNNCWEENFSIEQIEKEPVVINNRSYMQYKMYQGVFFPLSAEDIVFPSIELQMKKYLRSRRMSFFGNDGQEKIETFATKRKVVKVKELPPHPLRDQVAVGNYKLDETISSTSLNTGQAFNYNFKIVGEGNIAGLSEPFVKEDKSFEFYSPNIKQNINRAGNRVTGAKTFSYHGIPNEPGNYDLKNYFSWIYFNPVKKAYDTLSSNLVLDVTGESKTNAAIGSSDLGSFYNQMDIADNTIYERSDSRWMQYLLNAFIIVMIIATLVVLIKK